MSAGLPAPDLLARRRADIEASLRAIVHVSSFPVPRLRSAMRYAVVSPGKRIRPLLAVLCAEHLGAELSAVMSPACALELVHAASLVLDDLPCMDDAAERRGQPTVHAAFGEEVAALTVVALISEAYALIAKAPGLSDPARCELVRILSATIGADGLAGGQEIDLRRGMALSALDIDELHRRKTGSLFVAAVEVAAVVAEANVEQRASLRLFAEELGLAFQALDDIADAQEVAKGAANVISVIGEQGARRRATGRLESAKAALAHGGPGLAAVGGFVDVLMGQALAAP